MTAATTEISPEEAEAVEGKSFWDELWKLKTTTEQVFELISPTDVRKLRASQPTNLHSLFDQAICQLCHFIERPLPLYYDHALNCVRVLTRLIPFMLENPDDELVTAWCWQVEDAAAAAAAMLRRRRAASPSSPAVVLALTAEPLALAVHAVVNLLFCRPSPSPLGVLKEEKEEDVEEAGGGGKAGSTPSSMTRTRPARAPAAAGRGAGAWT